MRLSEAVLLGSMIGPQIPDKFYRDKDKATCLMGAGLLSAGYKGAWGIIFTEDFEKEKWPYIYNDAPQWVKDKMLHKYNIEVPSYSTFRDAIVTLNNKLKATREEIVQEFIIPYEQEVFGESHNTKEIDYAVAHQSK